MKDEDKAKDLLINELVDLRQRITDLKKSEIEFKQTEEKLRESEERYRGLYESSIDGIASSDMEGNFVGCNQAYADMLGYTQEELFNLSYKDITPSKWYYVDAQIVAGKILQRGYSDEWEKEYIRKDGTIFPASVRVWLIKDKEGNPTGMWDIIRDITERKQAEQELHRERDKSISILESMADGVYIVNQNYDIEYVNSILKQEFGLPEGRKCYEYFHDRNEICPWCKNQEVFTGKTVRWEWYSFKNNKTYDLIDTPIKNPDGSVSKLEIFRDITDRKQAEEALRKQTHDLGERVKELNCLYGISKLVEKRDISLEELLQRIVELIPPAWQYPEITCTRIIIEDEQYITANFKESKWKQARAIMVYGKAFGILEVYYLEEKPGSDEGPFLKEERNLIYALAEQLGRIIERKKMEETMRKNEEKYRIITENHIDLIDTLDMEGIIQFV
ncbi:PAS domain S-box protein, partial [Candidatus Pacearchaeota archaeon]|nr:PAS domain S-box protein [Candidatus Pacearchaeota archaeon]